MLQGMGGVQWFNVMRVPAERHRSNARGPRGGGGGGGRGGGSGEDDDVYALPTSATCFNTLRLPEYPPSRFLKGRSPPPSDTDARGSRLADAPPSCRHRTERASGCRTA